MKAFIRLASVAGMIVIISAGVALAQDVAPPSAPQPADSHADAPAPAVLKIGSPAPAFTLQGADGKSHSLGDYRGRLIVLEWTNPQCPYVRKHYGTGAMQKLQNDEIANNNVAWLRIDSSGKGKEGYLDVTAANALIGSDGSKQTAFLLDPDGKVGKLYNATATPDMIVIDKAGLVQYTGAIDSAPSTDPATLDNAENYVREAIDAVKDGKPVGTPVTQPYGCSVKYAD